MMSGLGFDYLIKKVALFCLEYVLVISALFIGEKLIIEYLTKKIVKGFYSNIFLNSKLSKISLNFLICQLILFIFIILILIVWIKILKYI